jgi:sialic acid synthase SpsE
MKNIYLISEIGINHNGDLNRAYNLISQAKQCGFDAVKFQLYEAERLTADSELRELLHAGAFKKEWLPWIRGVCDDLQIDLAITPFYPEAVEIIEPYVDWIKIGSYELNYQDLISAAVESGLPIIASAGFVENPFDKVAIKNLKALLYCIPKYPCSPEDIYMTWVKTAKNNLGCPIGYSDHSHNPGVIWAALIAGAEYIEMHFDTNGVGLEYKQGHVWKAEECFDLIHNIKSAFKCFESTSFRPDFSKQTNQYGRRE